MDHTYPKFCDRIKTFYNFNFKNMPLSKFCLIKMLFFIFLWIDFSFSVLSNDNQNCSNFTDVCAPCWIDLMWIWMDRIVQKWVTSNESCTYTKVFFMLTATDRFVIWKVGQIRPMIIIWEKRCENGPYICPYIQILHATFGFKNIQIWWSLTSKFPIWLLSE